MGRVRMSCMVNGCQGMVAGVSFRHSIHQRALALEVGYKKKLSLWCRDCSILAR